MAKAGYWISARSIKPIISSYPAETITKSPNLFCQAFRVGASLKKNELPLIITKNQRASRRLITISTAEGKWHGKWDSDYSFSLRDLQLEDLAEDGDREAQVFINLCIHKHAGFGLSVDGRVSASFTRKCSNCSAPYCGEIDTNFNVWVLSSTRNSSSPQIPEIGGDDPSVIYVKPGCEADLDSLVQDTIRLTTSVEVQTRKLAQSCVRKPNPKYSI